MSSSNVRLYIYYLLIFMLSLFAFYLFHRITRNQPSDYLFMEKCILCIISSFFNIFVLYYHYTHAPHPKFVILPYRRFAIYVHIISGVTEFTTFWIAFITGSERIATLAAITAIFAHVPSAYYQTSIVFGAKALMVSGYLFAISLHLFCAVNLFLQPISTYWLLNMFLVHNIYVWCRVFYFFFGFAGLFKDTIYTNSILTSGLLLFPSVLGVSANMLFLGYVALSILLYFFIVWPDENQRAGFVSERTRDLLVNRDVHNAWIKEKLRLVRMMNDMELSDTERAKKVFNELDENKNGTIDGEEVANLLKEWKVATSFVDRFVRSSKKRDMSFEFFYRNVWRLGNDSIAKQKETRKLAGKAKARFVFDSLDTDSSGFIDCMELQKLLIQWGLPENEVDAYLANDEDQQISFDEFYQQFQPIWDFAYENIALHNSG